MTIVEMTDWQKILDTINNTDNLVVLNSEFRHNGYVFILEENKTGCLRLVSNIEVTNNGKAFFSSRQTALEAYTAALSVQDYNANIINNIEKVRLELL